MEIMIISGKSQSGKDTFANLMRAKLEAAGCNCITVHFADLVKYYAKQYYNWNEIKDDYGRNLLQQLGTNKVREKFPNYWAEIVGKFLAAVPDDFDCAFIPDARFENEIEMVKKYNSHAYVIRMERFEKGKLSQYINPELTEEQRNHPSETSLDDYEDWDYIVENFSLDALKDSAEAVLADTGLLK